MIILGLVLHGEVMYSILSLYNKKIFH